MKALFQTTGDMPGFILRIMLGVVMFPHGAQKFLGWYGGNGFSGTMGFFRDQMGFPAIVAFLVIIGEFFGSLGLLVELLTRFTAASLIIIMGGAVMMVHLPHGFFMNWFDQQAGEGYEYHLLVIGMYLTLMVTGAGRWSLDREIANRLT